MSDNRDNIWDDEEDNDFESFDADTDLVKKLRKALKAEQKRNKELESTLGDLTKSQKERILKDALASRGVNPKIAQFVPSDIEASEDAIGAWLDSNGDVFGYKPSEKSKVAQQDIAAMQRMDSALTGAETPASSDDLLNRITNAGSEDEILSILSGN
jgi:hypothetical protein